MVVVVFLEVVMVLPVELTVEVAVVVATFTVLSVHKLSLLFSSTHTKRPVVSVNVSLFFNCIYVRR